MLNLHCLVLLELLLQLGLLESRHQLRMLLLKALDFLEELLLVNLKSFLFHFDILQLIPGPLSFGGGFHQARGPTVLH